MNDTIRSWITEVIEVTGASTTPDVVWNNMPVEARTNLVNAIEEAQRLAIPMDFAKALFMKCAVNFAEKINA